MRAPSIREVARLAGVNPSSVSRALSGSSGVSAAKRREIVRIARQVGYVPDRRASDLRSGRRSGIVVVVEQRPTEIAAARNQALYAIGAARLPSVSVVVAGARDALGEIVRAAVTPATLGIVVSGVRAAIPRRVRAMAERSGVAIVTVDAPEAGVDGVEIDRAAGTFEVASFFIRMGFRAPLYLSAAATEAPDERLSGILQAYRSAARTFRSGRLLALSGTSGFEDGYRIADQVVSKRADAVFAYSDRVAIGMLRRFAERGIRVPEDVAVVGFDDLPVARFLAIGLSTVSQPVEECALEAVAMIERRAAWSASTGGEATRPARGAQAGVPSAARSTEEGVSSPLRAVFPTRLVLRETTPGGSEIESTTSPKSTRSRTKADGSRNNTLGNIP